MFIVHCVILVFTLSLIVEWSHLFLQHIEHYTLSQKTNTL